MLRTNGADHPTIADAAREFGVTVKTVREWIARGIIDEPPVVDYGLREIQTFPKEYVAKAKQRIKQHQAERRAKRKRGGGGKT